MKNLTKLEAFEAALAVYKTQQKMADAIGVHQTTIWKALSSSKEVRAEWVLQIEADTGVSRHDLRPDIYPRPLNHPEMVSDMDAGEYGNRNPFLGKGVAA